MTSKPLESHHLCTHRNGASHLQTLQGKSAILRTARTADIGRHEYAVAGLQQTGSSLHQAYMCLTAADHDILRRSVRHVQDVEQSIGTAVESLLDKCTVTNGAQGCFILPETVRILFRTDHWNFQAACNTGQPYRPAQAALTFVYRR